MDSETLEKGDDVLYQELGDEIVLLNLSDQLYYGLDDVGARMWKSLVETGSVSRAAAHISEIYNVDQPTVLKDMENLVGDLLSARLLKKNLSQADSPETSEG